MNHILFPAEDNLDRQASQGDQEHQETEVCPGTGVRPDPLVAQDNQARTDSQGQTGSEDPRDHQVLLGLAGLLALRVNPGHVESRV